MNAQERPSAETDAQAQAEAGAHVGDGAGDPPGVNQSASVSGDGAHVTQIGRDLNVFGGGAAVQRLMAPDTPAGVCPYPGLSAFEQEQARWFFGRDRVTADLLGLVAQRVHEGGLAAVVAPSGAGKTSLLRAGLLVGLERGLPTPGSQLWPRQIMTPTARPLAALGSRLADLGDGAPLPDGELDPNALSAWCSGRIAAWRAVHEDPDARLLLIVDQFEELFTLCADERERRAFVALLARMAEPDADGRTLTAIVVGVRADFYARCADYEPLRLALATSQLLIGPMDRQELHQAITAPAEMVGLGLEPGLEEVLLRDLGVTVTDAAAAAQDGYEAGRLPFLAYALQATWQQRQGTMLTVAGYQATGGIQHAIANRAEYAYNRLDADGQRLARTLLLRLVKIGDGTEDTRRRLARADLLSLDAQDERADAVLEAFTRERLLSQERDTVEITHEALLRGWPRLRQWIDEDRADALARQEMEEAATVWDRAARRDSSLLYHGARLETAPETGISPRASAFLAASRRQGRRTRRLRRTVVAAVTALAVVASIAAAVAVRNQNRAMQAQDQAVFNELLAEADQLRSSDVSLAAQLDLIAYRMQPTSQQAATALVNAEDAPLSRVLTTSQHTFNGVAFSPDGRSAATTSANSFQLWDLADPAHISALGPAMQVESANVVNRVAFSPDGRTLAIAGGDDNVYLWNVADRTHPRAWPGKLAGHTGAVVSVAFSPDGRTLASAGQDDTVRLWDVTNPARPAPLGQPLTGATDIVWSVAFSPVGHTLAGASNDGTLRLWDVSDPAHPIALGQPLQSAAGGGTGFTALAFSSDGRYLAGGDDAGLVGAWDVTDPANPTVRGDAFTALAGPVSSLTFLPGQDTVAAGTRAGGIALWNLTSPVLSIQMSPDLLGHTDDVNAVAASPDGRYLASASSDGSVRLWSLPDTRHITGITWSMAISGDGRTVASAGTTDTRPGGVLRTWNAADPGRFAPLSRPVPTGTNVIRDIALTRAGRTLATVSMDGVVELWDTSDPARPTLLGPPLATESDQGQAVAFSPDGRTLATATTLGVNKSSLQLWDTTDPAHPAAIGKPVDLRSTGAESVSDVLSTLAFSPDGRTLAGAGSDTTIYLWDVTTPSHPEVGKLARHTDVIQALAFSPDGRTLASAGQDHTIRLWSVADPAHATTIGRPLIGHTKAVAALVFSPDGRTLASAGQEGAIRLWNVADLAALTPMGEPLTGITNLAFPTSLVFSPDGHALISGNNDGTIRVWDLRPASAVSWICHSTANISRAQWDQYVSRQLAYAPPCT